MNIIPLFESHKEFILGFSFASILLFLLSILSLPIFVSFLPTRFFIQEKKMEMRGIFFWFFILGKNIFGWILIMLGILMLVLPGQGILTILLGLGLIDFPGKKKIERKILSNANIRQSLNWMRRKMRKDDFKWD